MTKASRQHGTLSKLGRDVVTFNFNHIAAVVRFMQFEILTTQRLRLRKLTHEVYKYVFENYSDTEIKEFLGLTSEAELVTEKEKYNKGISTYNRSFCYFQLIDHLTDNIIGSCGFHNWFAEHNRAEIGYKITNYNYKQKGLMSEAAEAIIDYGFNTLKLHRIEALVGPDNVASIKLLKKMNFVQEGILREHYFENDKMDDSIIFGLFRQEWKPNAL